MTLATVADVNAYVPLETSAVGAYFTSLSVANHWVGERVHGVWPAEHPPAAVREAVALLAAVFICDPLAMRDESRVPNMVRLMLVPYSK
jgi:hypothetical protein